MQKQAQSDGQTPMMHAAESAFQALQSGAGKVATTTEKTVKQYPLAAVGLALGGGIAAGVIGYRLLTPKPKSLFHKLGLAALAITAARGLTRLGAR